VRAEDDLLGDASAERDADAGQEVLLVVREAVDVGGGDGDAERLTAEDDRHLADGVGPWPSIPTTACPASWYAVRRRSSEDLALRAEHDALERVGEVRHGDLLVSSPRSRQGRLVGQVGQIGPDHSRRGRSHGVKVDVRGERPRSRVDGEDLAAPVLVRRRDVHATIEAPRT
jgi:hypothetical protein